MNTPAPSFARFVGYSRTARSVLKFNLRDAAEAAMWRSNVSDWSRDALAALVYAVYPDGRRERWI